jgi:hypothetical protein
MLYWRICYMWPRIMSLHIFLFNSWVHNSYIVTHCIAHCEWSVNVYLTNNEVCIITHIHSIHTHTYNLKKSRGSIYWLSSIQEICEFCDSQFPQL